MKQQIQRLVSKQRAAWNPEIIRYGGMCLIICWTLDREFYLLGFFSPPILFLLNNLSFSFSFWRVSIIRNWKSHNFFFSDFLKLRWPSDPILANEMWRNICWEIGASETGAPFLTKRWAGKWASSLSSCCGCWYVTRSAWSYIAEPCYDYAVASLSMKC